MRVERDPIEVAWAAGLFEGEGSWTVTRGRSAQARLTSTDEDVVRRFAAIIGYGDVFTRRPIGGGRVAPGTYKTQFIWQLCNAPQVRALIRLFEPFLSERRVKKAREILAATEGIGSQGRSRYAVMDWN